DVGAAFARAVWKEARIDEHATLNFVNAFRGDVLGELLDDNERVARKSGAAVGMVFVDEGEGAVGLDAIRKVGIAASDENQIALEGAMLVDRAGVVDTRVEAIIGAELCKEGAFGECFSRGGRHEELISIERVENFAGVEGIKLDAEIRVREFRAAHDFLDTL